jgi:small subunit ribosomal protein S21
MRKALVRVELRELSHSPSYEERDRAFKNLLAAFKRQVNESGILSEYKQRQYYESPSEKRKRKKKEAQLELQKEKIRGHFSNKKD